MSQPPVETRAPRDRWYVLAVLTAVYAMNIADRFSIATLLEPIRRELHLSDSGIAFLTGFALALFYVTVGIPIAALADRGNRRNILAVSLALWSSMTALCGLARNYGELLLARFAVGIGEAGGTPPSTSILADKFPPAARPMALTIFALGACLGSWLGSSVAGAAAERGGWRLAFLVLGIPGAALALLVAATVREPRRGQLDSHAAAAAPGAARLGLLAIFRQLADTARYMARQRAAVHLVVGGSVATFWSWGLMWWTPTFLQRSHQLSVGEAGGLLGPMHLIAGTAGTLFASVVMGLPAARDPRFVTRFLSWLTVLGTVPSFLAYEVASLRTATVLLWIFVPAVYFYIGPILGLLQNVMPANMRAGAVAILLFTANVANLILAPQLIGVLSDWFAGSFGAGRESLRWALLLLATTGLWAAWHLWVAGKTVREDEARAT
ncbi:MAG TPA: MFS transporter [Steroidobacteraceae bacterium]|nr:MFS transporter [Steroidobacteraceae bacterium]